MYHWLGQRRRTARAALVLGFLLAAALTLSGWRLSVVCRQIAGDTLRLHIRANSDSWQDQLLKLQVRDAVLQQAAELFASAQNVEQAQQQAAAALPALQRTAQRAVAAHHGKQPVTVRLLRERFSPTSYPGFTLPGGDYMALRIDIGSAQGHNWFCVLYPALCLSASGAEYCLPQENAVVFGDYQLRLAALDWVQNFVGHAGTSGSPPA